MSTTTGAIQIPEARKSWRSVNAKRAATPPPTIMAAIDAVTSAAREPCKTGSLAGELDDPGRFVDPPNETVGIGAAIARAERWLGLAAIFFAVLVLGSWLLIAFARVDDTFGTVGPWSGLASYAAHGTLYPPLFDGENFGGTRYMPLQFLLYAGMSNITGEFFVSAKIVAAIVAAALLALVYLGLRSIGCRRPEALAVTGVVLAAGPVLEASLANAGDSVAVVMQLAAVITITRRYDSRAVTLAGGLCGLAFLAKLSAIWAPVAIAIWLFKAVRRMLPTFLASYAATAGFGLLAIYLASDGRVFDNLSLVSTGGFRSFHDLTIGIPRVFVTLLNEHAQSTWLLIPLAAVGLVIAAAQRRVSLYQSATVVAVLVTFVVLTDEGAAWNHLIDVSVLLPIAAAEVVVRTSAVEVARRIASSLLLTAAVVGMAAGYLFQLRPQLSGSIHGLRPGVADPRFPRSPLKGIVGARDTFLSQDASIAVARGQRPVVLDSYMVLRILKQHPRWQRTLVRRIDAREFDKVVLLFKLDPSAAGFTRLDFGRAVASAIDRNYRLEATTSGGNRYWIYVPRLRRARPA